VNVTSLADHITERDRAMVAGFTDPAAAYAKKQRTVLLRKVRARAAAVELHSRKERVTWTLVSEQSDIAVRTLQNDLLTIDALFAFPPPEFADAIASVCANSANERDFERNARNLMRDLDGNSLAKKVIFGLAHIHRENSRIAQSDNFFAYQLRNQLQGMWNSDEHAVRWTGMFTEAIRATFAKWALHPTWRADKVSDVLFDYFSTFDPGLSWSKKVNVKARR
jgi:hypothetical protein